MINALHLFWILPLCFTLGYTACAIIVAGGLADERMDEIMRKENEKSQKAMEED